jgi:HAD superfamily phosphoserine phosphatase-like hydrolase
VTYVAVDVDGTLTHSNVSFAFGRFLYRNGVISFFQAVMPALYYWAQVLGCISVECLHRRIFKTLFYGRSGEYIERIADEFLHLSSTHLIRRQIQKELFALRRDGAHLALLSSSPDFLVKKVASLLDIEEWHATEYIVDDRGRFSGVGRVVTGTVKAEIVREVRRRQGSFIIAMSDSILDLPLLEAADEAVAVFPDRRLSRCARHRGWRVVKSG